MILKIMLIFSILNLNDCSCNEVFNDGDYQNNLLVFHKYAGCFDECWNQNHITGHDLIKLFGIPHSMEINGRKQLYDFVVSKEVKYRFYFKNNNYQFYADISALHQLDGEY